MNVLRNKAFSLVEILIVVFIISILVSVSAPVYSHFTRRAKMAEAVALASKVRAKMRELNVTLYGQFYDVFWTKLPNDLPAIGAISPSGVPDDGNVGLEIDPGGVSQYFSNSGVLIFASNLFAPPGLFVNPSPVDFVIRVGSKNNNLLCSSTVTQNCAIHADEVEDYRLITDNTGRMFVSYNSGTTWEAY